MSEQEQASAPSPRDVLQAIQQALRTPDTDRKELIGEMNTLARILGHLPSGDGEGNLSVNMGALAGIFYCATRLKSLYDPDNKIDPMAMMDLYAEGELSSFDLSDEDRQKSAEFFKEERVIVRKADMNTGTAVYTVYISHMNQTSHTGTVMKEGEMLHALRRFPAPWNKVLDELEYR